MNNKDWFFIGVIVGILITSNIFILSGIHTADIISMIQIEQIKQEK